MKISLKVLLALVATTQTKESSYLGEFKNYMTNAYQELFDGAAEHGSPDSKMTVNRFGNRELILSHNVKGLDDSGEGFNQKLIHLDANPKYFAVDYKQQAQHLEHLTSIFKGEK